MRRVTEGSLMFGGSRTASSRTPVVNRVLPPRTEARAVATLDCKASAVSPAMRPRKRSSVHLKVGTT